MFISFSKFLPFYIIFILAGTIERVSSTFFYKETNATKIIYHKWSFLAPFWSYLFIILFSICEYFLTVEVINLNISTLGFIIFSAGVILRRKSIAGLNKNWSVYIEIKEGHEVVTIGIYKFLKHPYCLAVLFELIGVCLIGNTFHSLVLVFLIQAPLLMIRIILEERVLLGYFGDVYKNYRNGKLL